MFDIVIVAISVLAFADGLRKGIISELATLVALIVGVYGAARFSPLTEQIIAPFLGDIPTRLVAFGVTLLLIVMAVHALSRLLTKLLRAMSLGMINRLAGGLFCTAKVLLIVSCCIGLLNRIWPGDEGFLSEAEKDEMMTYRFVESFSGFVFPYIDQGLEAVKDIKDNIQLE